MSTEISPLAEASPRSLEDILNDDPLKLTEQDRKEVVTYLRRARESFLAQDSAKLSAAEKKDLKAKAEPAPKKVAMDPTKQLTLDDLDI